MTTHDVIIIGGGIAGLGVARECAISGLSPLVLEATTCGSATSNNTLRIIHGGFRYLQSLDFPRVIKSLNDQTALINELPNAITPLPCLMPLSRFGLKSRVPVTCAALLYGAITRMKRSPLSPPRVVSGNWINTRVELLRGRAPHGALLWHDATMTNPDLVTAHLISQITNAGGTIRESASVVAVTGAAPLFTVRTASGETFSTRHVINTLGPWIGSIDIPPHLAGSRPQWCRGFNIVISRQLDPTYGIGVESADGRLLFCVPRGNGTAIGTWYTPHPDVATPPTVSNEEISLLIAAFNDSFPRANVSHKEITHIDVGILPMLAQTPKGPKLIAHEQIHERDGYIEVLSTKYTTFRSQGRATLAAMTRKSR